MRFSHFCVRRRAAPLLVMAFAMLGGCAVYQPLPALAAYADGTVTYAAQPAVVGAAPAYPAAPYSYAPYSYAPYSYAPYYVGPPVSLGLWFGRGGRYHRHGWGGRYYGHGSGYGGGHGIGRGYPHGGGHGGWRGRRR